MNRDPYYYLQKADQFYVLAKANGYDPSSGRIISNKNNEEAITFIDDSDYSELNDETEYEIMDDTELETESLPPLKYAPMSNRLYDPITRHYYKSTEIPAGITRKVPVNSDVWYPENKLAYKTIYDPATGKRYRIHKIYNDDGLFHFEREELIQAFRKKPGTNYYRPVHLGVGK